MEHHVHHKVKRSNKVLALLQANAIPVSIIIAGVLIGAAVVLKNRIGGIAQGTDTTAPLAQDGSQPSGPTKPANIDEIKIAGNPFIGKENAPVVVAYWYDYQCPFCKQVETNVFPKLLSEYVNTGKVKLVFKGYPVLGQDSYSAALAERGVWSAYPDKFFKWHEQMFAKQDEENGGWGNRQDILEIAKSLGMNTDDLDKLIVANASQNQQNLQADLDEGQAYGVTGTPSFMIGKKLIVGSVPYNQVKAAIEAVLKSK
ncbi:MAG TPA: thioredoxin domain-containing protein [Candidatus Paceibacterota bacterium]|nr:thioredoxin domain-containing protein [Candidatus Paceibacterota bacterium]